MKFLRAAALLAAALALAACDRGGGGAADPTLPPVETGAAVETSAAVTVAAADSADSAADAVPETAASSPSSTASTVPAGPAVPDYEVRHRMIEDGNETLVVLIDPGSYSNVELENLVYDIVETHSPRGAVVVDDSAAADLAVLDERTAEQQASLDSHTLLRIDNGVEVTFHGPYADFPGLTVGS